MTTSPVARFGRAVRDAGWSWAAFAVYLLLHVLVVAGLPTPRFPTSAEYLDLSFLGHARRLWTVPLIYKVLPTDTWRIGGQTLLSAAAWWMLASVAASMVRDRRVDLGLSVVILTLGLCSSVSAWNTAILSESVSISLTVLLIAAWLSYANRPSATAAGLAAAATLLWTFTRQEHAIVVCAITALVLLSAVRRPRDTVRVALAVTLVALTLYGVFAATRNKDLVRYNLAAIVGVRILPNSDYTDWFIEHGMPYTSKIASYQGVYPPEPLGDDPDFAQWAQTKGTRTYLDFVLSHPRYALWDMVPYLSGERPSFTRPAPPVQALTPDPTPSLLSLDSEWTRHRDVVPGVAQDLLFERGAIGDVIVLMVVAFTLVGVAWRRYGWDRRFLVPGLIVASVLPHALLVWLTSATELDRHAIDVGVSARVGLWLLAAYALDRILTGAGTPDPQHV